MIAGHYGEQFGVQGAVLSGFAGTREVLAGELLYARARVYPL